MNYEMCISLPKQELAQVGWFLNLPADMREKMLQGELLVTQKENLVKFESGIYELHQRLTSRGLTHHQWIKKLRKYGSLTEHLLLSKDFQTTTNTEYKTCILPGNLLSHTDRSARGASEYTRGMLSAETCPEVACLMIEQISGFLMKSLGLTDLIIMHKPITHQGKVYRFTISQRDNGYTTSLYAICGFDEPHSDKYGFAFAHTIN